MKVLHLGNIANMAFAYSKFLRQSGVDSDVLCYDLTHVLSMPEWYEGDFYVEQLDEMSIPDNPAVRAVKLPDWYHRISTSNYWGKHKGDKVNFDYSAREQLICQESARYGYRWKIFPSELAAYRLLAETLQDNFFQGYNIALGYAYAAVPLYLVGFNRFVCVEIGTLRDIYKVDSPLNRILAQAYKASSHVLITNADCNQYAEELGLKQYSYLPHPVDEDVFAPIGVKGAETLKSLGLPERIFLAPARQDWKIKGNNLYLEAFARLLSQRTDVTLVICEWGPDVERAHALVAERGLQPHVKWIKPLPERTLAKVMASSELVLDQFGGLGTFGLIGPKAMACGTPCVLHFDVELHRWCFPETPPVLSAATVEEILMHMHDALDGAHINRQIGIKSRKWIEAYHSKAVVRQALQDVFVRVHNIADVESSQQHSWMTAELPNVSTMSRLGKFGTMFHRVCTKTNRMLQAVVRRIAFLLNGPRIIVQLQHSFDGGFQELRSEIRHALIEFERIVCEIRDENRTYRAKSDTLEMVCNELRAKSDTLEMVCNELRAKSDTQQMVCNELRAKSDTQQMVCNELRAKSDTLEMVCNELRACIDSQRASIELLLLGERKINSGNLSNVLDVMSDGLLRLEGQIRHARHETLCAMLNMRPHHLQFGCALDKRPEYDSERAITLKAAQQMLIATAPENWNLYQVCLDAGTESYRDLPITSCSTEAHEEAKLFKKFLGTYLTGYVLDIGCGPQPVPYYLTGYPDDAIFGIDPISENTDHPFEFYSGVGEFLPWKDESFDIVVSGTTLDHYYLLDKGLKEVARILKRGGHFVAWITEFSNAPPYNPLLKMESAYDSEHMYHINREWFIPMMTDIGLDAVEIILLEIPFNFLFMAFVKR
ncbi:MAG: methyltransferase domain-containing protein [Candidatus Tectomicrobia bacterium]|uniref:Methyltransferase domain-containing protein n=1 Tax=Tectimicrobiota bacterium TaxID=2528274 RepID=A0A937VYZ3_UNCTE|nr:methyltransferase domain-containing protein [Candidatus Tectomicrobia bacterium]